MYWIDIKHVRGVREGGQERERGRRIEGEGRKRGRMDGWMEGGWVE